ncbi:hypothetical protein AAFF_G00168170 [Aldrovandia affinis]|uniref:Uncharacterized protein n=1 Tax=Aldrovandia affinis TaxID=143900 RepID=A0AAD7R0K9_9TELE|nr:hypothetical protein AAFF_G00168170 [Aldrovandia affinis]
MFGTNFKGTCPHKSSSPLHPASAPKPGSKPKSKCLRCAEVRQLHSTSGGPAYDITVRAALSTQHQLPNRAANRKASAFAALKSVSSIRRQADQRMTSLSGH